MSEMMLLDKGAIDNLRSRNGGYSADVLTGLGVKYAPGKTSPPKGWQYILIAAKKSIAKDEYWRIYRIKDKHLDAPHEKEALTEKSFAILRRLAKGDDFEAIFKRYPTLEKVDICQAAEEAIRGQDHWTEIYNIRDTHPNHLKKWTIDDEARLIEFYKRTQDPNELEARFGRKVFAIYAKLERMGQIVMAKDWIEYRAKLVGQKESKSGAVKDL